MMTSNQIGFVSEKSVASPYLVHADTATAGKVHLIDLPTITNDKIDETIGKKIAQGGYGVIYKVNGCDRVYKVIPLDEFNDGDEIRISKIAAEIGVGPTFYSAFIVQQREKKYVFIEMEDAGSSLGKWMENFAEETMSAVEKPSEKCETDGMIATEIEVKPRVSLEIAVHRIYGNEETFYFELFSKIKRLAEKKISYCDSNVGNIMPNRGTEKGLQLIDFDKASIMKSTESALLASMRGGYNIEHLNKFKKLSNLSEESLKLIAAFKEQRGFWQ